MRGENGWREEGDIIKLMPVVNGCYTDKKHLIRHSHRHTHIDTHTHILWPMNVAEGVVLWGRIAHEDNK